jgi:hypothetical protein
MPKIFNELKKPTSTNLINNNNYQKQYICNKGHYSHKPQIYKNCHKRQYYEHNSKTLGTTHSVGEDKNKQQKLNKTRP